MKTLALAPPPELYEDRRRDLQDHIRASLDAIRSSRDDRIRKLRQYRKMHDGDMGWRKDRGGIFKLSNIMVPVCKAIAQSYKAKLHFEFVQERMLTVKPRGVEDKSEAEQFEKYWAWELDDQIGLPRVRSSIIHCVVEEGTAITKARWKTDASYIKRLQPVMQPSLDQDGLPVFDPMTGEPVMVPSGKDETVSERILHYDNAELVQIPFEDFLCDITAPTLEDSALLGYRYDMPVWQLLDTVEEQAREMERQGAPLDDGVWPPGWVPSNMLALADIARGGDGQGPSVGSKEDAELRAAMEFFGERQFRGQRTLPNDVALKSVRLAEVILRFDVDGDDQIENVLCIIERDQGFVLYCDYLANAYATNKQPYVAHRVIPVRNRWYGLGVYEFMEQEQKFLDLVFNRVNHRSGLNANPQEWVDESAFEAGGIPTDSRPGGRWRVKTGRNGGQARGIYELPQREQIEMEFIKLWTSFLQLISGVTNPAAGDTSSLPSNSTARGVEAILSEGGKVFAMMGMELQPSFKRATQGCAEMVQQGVKVERVLRYDQGLEEVTARISPDKIREMEFDIQIGISKTTQRERLESNQLAVQLINTFVVLPPQYQIRLRGLYVEMLRAIGLVDANLLLPSTEELEQDQSQDAMLEQIAGRLAAAAEQIQGANLDPSKKVAMELLAIADGLRQLSAQPPEAAGGAQRPGAATEGPTEMAGAPTDMMPPAAVNGMAA